MRGAVVGMGVGDVKVEGGVERDVCVVELGDPL